MLKISILDGYIDEPTCLGVPPYISPYPRYITGAILAFDKFAKISYVTIDQFRNNKKMGWILGDLTDMGIFGIGFERVFVKKASVLGFLSGFNYWVFVDRKLTGLEIADSL